MPILACAFLALHQGGVLKPQSGTPIRLPSPTGQHVSAGSLSPDALRRLIVDSKLGSDADEPIRLSAKALVVPGRATMGFMNAMEVDPEEDSVHLVPTHGDGDFMGNPIVALRLMSLKKGTSYLLVLNLVSSKARLVAYLGAGASPQATMTAADLIDGTGHVPLFFTATGKEQYLRLSFTRRKTNDFADVDLNSIDVHAVK